MAIERPTWRALYYYHALLTGGQTVAVGTRNWDRPERVVVSEAIHYMLVRLHHRPTDDHWRAPAQPGRGYGAEHEADLAAGSSALNSEENCKKGQLQLPAVAYGTWTVAAPALTTPGAETVICWWPAKALRHLGSVRDGLT